MTTAYFLGDSLTSSVLADALCARMGWTYVARAPGLEPPGGTLDGVGGSGYLEPGSGTVFGSTLRLGYVIAAATDVVFVIGGGNDNSLDDAGVIAAADAFWTALRAGLPSAALYSSPLHRPPDAVKLAGIVAAGARAGATYIDASTWAPDTSDGVHPTAAGNVYLGQRLAYELGVDRVSGLLLDDGSPLGLEVPTQ